MVNVNADDDDDSGYIVDIGICQDGNGAKPYNDTSQYTYYSSPIVIQDLLDICDADSTCTGITIQSNYTSYADTAAWGEMWHHAQLPTTGNDNSGYHCLKPIPETCSDNIQNQDETGVDCGGSICDPCVTDLGGDDCKGLDEAGCAAQADSCHAKVRSGKFRKCKPKRCKPMTETECEAAVHCEAKNGRRGEYKRCRRINSSRASA